VGVGRRRRRRCWGRYPRRSETHHTTTIGLLKQKHAFEKASGWRDKKTNEKSKRRVVVQPSASNTQKGGTIGSLQYGMTHQQEEKTSTLVGQCSGRRSLYVHRLRKISYEYRSSFMNDNDNNLPPQSANTPPLGGLSNTIRNEYMAKP
jgi:hypothetical protein